MRTILVVMLVLMSYCVVAGDIGACQTLNAANTVYTLTKTVNATGTCFSVTAVNVTLDCQGYAVIGNRTGHGVYINGYSATNIRNCTISNWSYPVEAFNSPFLRLENDRINSSVFATLIQEGSDNATIADSTFSGGTEGGIFLLRVKGTSVLRSQVTGATLAGIEVREANDTIIAGCNISGNTQAGIFLHNFTRRTRAENNTVSGNGLNGVEIMQSQDSIIRFNDIRYSAADGVYVYSGSSGNEIGHNNITGGQNAGIRIKNSQDNTVIGNRIVDNTENSAILVYSTGGTASGNRVIGNTLINVDFGLDVETTQDILLENNTITGAENDAIFIWDVTNVTFRNINISDTKDLDEYASYKGTIYHEDVRNSLFEDILIKDSAGTVWETQGAEANNTWRRIVIQNATTGFILDTAVNARLDDITITAVNAPIVVVDLFNTTFSNTTLPAVTLRKTGLTEMNLSSGIDAVQALGLGTITLGFKGASIMTATEPRLNRSALITFYGLSLTDAEATVDAEDDGSFITCPEPVCTERSYAGGTFTFNVSHFTNFSAQEDTTPDVVPEFSTWLMLFVALGVVVAGITRLRKK